MDIGSFIRSERAQLKLTQEKLGRLIGTTGKTVSNIERGVGNPSRGTLRKLADALGRSLDELDRMCGGKAA